MEEDEGNESVNQAVEKASLLSYSRTGSGDNPVRWRQLLHDKKEDFPVLASQMVELQNCNKCCQRFCSSINYKRHTRVHLRSYHFDKDFYKNRELLGVFWEKLSQEEANEIVSFDDVWLKKIPGTSVLNSLVLTLNKPDVFTLPQLYRQCGSILLNIIQNKIDKFKISSREIIIILENTSEGTFFSTGSAESLQNEIIKGEDENVLLDFKNIVACVSLLFEQKLVKAWFAYKDAEALRFQNLLVEEENTAEKRQAKLDKKRQKKLRQKEKKGKEQINVDEATDTLIEGVNEAVDKVDTIIQGVNEAVSSEISISNSADQIEYSSKGNDDVDLKAQFNSQFELTNDDGDFTDTWQVKKSRKNQSLKFEPVQKRESEPKRDTSTKVYSRKVPQRDTSTKVEPVKRQERERETTTKVEPLEKQEPERDTSTNVWTRKERERDMNTKVELVKRQEPERDTSTNVWTRIEAERDTRSKVEVGIFDDKSFPELQTVTKTTQIEDTSSSCKLMLGGSIPVHISKSEPKSEKKDSDSAKAVLVEKITKLRQKKKLLIDALYKISNLEEKLKEDFDNVTITELEELKCTTKEAEDDGQKEMMEMYEKECEERNLVVDHSRNQAAKIYDLKDEIKKQVAAKRVVTPYSYETSKAFHDKRCEEALEGEHEVLTTKKEEEPVSEADIQKPPVSPNKRNAK